MLTHFPFTFLIAGTLLVSSSSGVSRMTDLLWEARAEKRLIPALSKVYPDLNIESAYRVQKEFVVRILATDRIGGFKVGLDSLAGQKRFSLLAPIGGVLPDSGKHDRSFPVNSSLFRRLALETELAFEVGRSIERPIRDVASLRERIRALMPAIELPEMGFADMKHLKGVDIISANAGAAGYILGERLQAGTGSIERFSVILSRNGQRVNRWVGTMESRWKSALWLVNKMVSLGWRIEPGHILMTGALGKILAGKPGKYVADFGKVGRISFEIK